MDLDVMIQSRMTAITERRKQLIRDWDPYISAVNRFMTETRSQPLTEYDKQNIAQCLENAVIETGLKSNARLLHEATTGDAIQFMAVCNSAAA